MILKDWLVLVIDLLKVISWPLVVLVVFLFLKEPIISFFRKLKEVELPGGTILKSIPEEIKEAKEIQKEILKEPKKAAAKNETSKINPNEIMKKLGLEMSLSNLELGFYYKLIDQNPNIALASLRIDLEIMLKNLARGFQISLENQYSVEIISNTLLNKGKITINQYRLIITILRICNAAIHGEKVTKDQALQVLNMAPVLINDYIAWLDWGFK